MAGYESPLSRGWQIATPQVGVANMNTGLVPLASGGGTIPPTQSTSIIAATPRSDLPAVRSNVPAVRSTAKLPEVPEGWDALGRTDKYARYARGLGRVAAPIALVATINDLANRSAEQTRQSAEHGASGSGYAALYAGATPEQMNSVANHIKQEGERGYQAQAEYLASQGLSPDGNTPLGKETGSASKDGYVSNIGFHPDLDAQQAMNTMAGNYAPVNTSSVSQGLGIDMPQMTPHVGNTRMPSMAKVNATLAQEQREEATRRAVQQSLPQRSMSYTMQPTVSVQPYGNGGTQFNLNQNTLMFDDPDYQRLYALRAQQAQQALANTNQPVTYDQALAHARAGTSWR